MGLAQPGFEIFKYAARILAFVRFYLIKSRSLSMVKALQTITERKEIVMEQQIYITLDYDLATGDVKAVFFL